MSTIEKLAIFDVDYTLTSRETLRQFYYYSLKRYPKNIIYAPRAIVSGLLFVMKIFDEKRTKEAFLKFIHGMDSEKMDELIKDFYENRFKNILYKDGIEMIRKLKSEGYKIYLISASPEFYLNELYEMKEIDKIIGTKFKKDETSYTRFMDGVNCKGEEKINRLMASLKEDNIEVDFKESYMFSDSLSDLPLLKLVGKPYLINYKKKYDGIEILNWK